MDDDTRNRKMISINVLMNIQLYVIGSVAAVLEERGYRVVFYKKHMVSVNDLCELMRLTVLLHEITDCDLTTIEVFHTRTLMSTQPCLYYQETEDIDLRHLKLR
jgi:hypothetical protein